VKITDRLQLGVTKNNPLKFNINEVARIILRGVLALIIVRRIGSRKSFKIPSARDFR